MDLKEMEKRRGWPWKKKNGFGEMGSTSPPTVKLFDEQEVARILEDQMRGQQEHLDSMLRELDEKHSEKEKTLQANLDAATKKLATALAEISVKDNLVKQHIKVAEEAVVGWERAENEAAEFKRGAEGAEENTAALEERVQHLDGALKEVVKQLRAAREEQERVRDTAVKKTHEMDKVRAETEAKLADASRVTAHTRAELIESRAETQALIHALQDRSRVLAEVNDTRALYETNIKVFQVRLEGMEKENIDLKYEIHLVTKELDSRVAELEHVRKTADAASRQHEMKVTKLNDECARLRSLLRKKLPNTAAVARLKQDEGKVSPRQRSLGRSQSAQDQQQDATALHEAFLEEKGAAEEKMFQLEEETRALKDVLARRNDELQSARIMCAKTASRLSLVEEEVEVLRSAASKSSQELLDQRSLVSKSRDNSLNFELMDDFIEMERLAESQSVSGSDRTTAETVFSDSNHSASLEEALAAKDKDLKAANATCEDLRTKLAAGEDQLKALQLKNSANEHSLVELQARLDSILETADVAMAVRKLVHITEALAQATGTASTPRTTNSDDIALSLHWRDETLQGAMDALVRAANTFIKSGCVLELVLELASALDCVLVVQESARVAMARELESAKVQVSELEEELCRMQADVKAQMDRLPELEQLRAEKSELEGNIAEMDQHLVEANGRVEALRVRLSESEALVAELKEREAAHMNEEKEEDLIERELMELSFPALGLASSMRAADAEMHDLHDKVAALEVELQAERRRHHDVVDKLEDMQEQIHRGVGRMDHVSRSFSNREGSEHLQLALIEDDATRTARKEKEIAAAALAECQRTILALGKQLKVLGFQDHDSPASPASPDSIEQMTRTMEFLRSQATELAVEQPASPGTSLAWGASRGRPALPHHIRANGVPLLLTSSEPSDSPALDLPPSPASPASPLRVLRSVRTIRGSPAGTFRRLYSRSQSETSMSSEHSNPGPPV